MPRYDFPSHRRRGWWRGPGDVNNVPDGDPNAPRWAEEMSKFQPPWWPDNEPWPPKRRPWARGRHRPFFRRLGCIFLLLNWFGIAVLITIVFLVLNALGLTSKAGSVVQWIPPIAGGLLVIVVSVMILVGTSLRGMSVPLDDLLAASQRLAEGDYAARVEVHGPQEVRLLSGAFNSMAARLQAQDRQRRSMLADVTHELRTPLTIIQGNLEGMLDGLYPPDEPRLRSILEETQILSRLTDDLRTLSLAESGLLELRREPTDLSGLVRQTIAAFRSQANSSGVPVELAGLPNEFVFNIDAERIRQVLSNLIANAVRYSPQGIPVRVAVAGDEREVTISVADGGPGIAEADLVHIFDRYYKSADSRGMGLGLSIAKYLIEAHGGRIEAQSVAGTGTRISFTLTA